MRPSQIMTALEPIHLLYIYDLFENDQIILSYFSRSTTNLCQGHGHFLDLLIKAKVTNLLKMTLMLRDDHMCSASTVEKNTASRFFTRVCNSSISLSPSNNLCKSPTYARVVPRLLLHCTTFSANTAPPHYAETWGSSARKNIFKNCLINPLGWWGGWANRNATALVIKDTQTVLITIRRFFVFCGSLRRPRIHFLTSRTARVDTFTTINMAIVSKMTLVRQTLLQCTIQHSNCNPTTYA